ncbi:MAG TPA: fused MFS/spermidine synthase [Candidatus Saccharimonadales bacterium]|jgi:spermidine synthase
MDYLRKVIYETDSDLNHYQVVEEVYSGRASRLLYSGQLASAQSGIDLDNPDKLLFEYNQRLVELVKQFKPGAILAIGGGAYTLPSYLIKKYPTLLIDVVEPDRGLDALSKRYFNLSSGFNIIHEYGLDYLKKNKKAYDLIIVDAYADQRIPDSINSKKFAKLAASSLNSNGLLVANVISSLAKDSVINNLHGAYKKHFKSFKVFPSASNREFAFTHNFIYVASQEPIKVSLKYPEVTQADFN